MKYLANHNTITAILTIITILAASGKATAACGGTQTSYQHSSAKPVTAYPSTTYANTTKSSTASISTASSKSRTSKVVPAIVDSTQMIVRKAKTEKPQPSGTIASQMGFTVIQELRPGSGLDLQDATHPAINRGIFSTRAAAEDTAELWRDVMPGWEVDVIEMAAN